MRIDQFNNAVKIAKSDEDLSAYEPNQINAPLSEVKKVSISVKSVAWLIRWQAFSIFGDINIDALDAIKYYGRYKFQVVQ